MRGRPRSSIAPPPRDQLALQRVLDAIYRSADEGRDVLL